MVVSMREQLISQANDLIDALTALSREKGNVTISLYNSADIKCFTDYLPMCPEKFWFFIETELDKCIISSSLSIDLVA